MGFVVDPRDIELAKMLVSHSIKVTPGDFVAIYSSAQYCLGLASAVEDEVSKAGGIPILKLSHPDNDAEHFSYNASEENLQKLADYQLSNMKQMQCCVFIGGGQTNKFDGSDFPPERTQLMGKYFKPVQEYRVKNTRWVVLGYPSPASAQMAEISTKSYADFYYKVCNVDYAYMEEAVKPLKELMDKTDRVRIVSGNDTDLSFSIKGINSIPCCGTHNVPDGECFTAPVRDSVNGKVMFNCPTIYDSRSFPQIYLEFENGKIIHTEAGSSKATEELNKILDRDEGARYVGEFALGFNPHITNPQRSILFDEKITGSFHMAMGRCYDEASNGNDSQNHWDMIQIQRPDWGGGEIYFDDVLIRKDGLFVLPELEGLNPDKYVQ